MSEDGKDCGGRNEVVGEDVGRLDAREEVRAAAHDVVDGMAYDATVRVRRERSAFEEEGASASPAHLGVPHVDAVDERAVRRYLDDGTSVFAWRGEEGGRLQFMEAVARLRTQLAAVNARVVAAVNRLVAEFRGRRVEYDVFVPLPRAASLEQLDTWRLCAARLDQALPEWLQTLTVAEVETRTVPGLLREMNRVALREAACAGKVDDEALE